MVVPKNKDEGELIVYMNKVNLSDIGIMIKFLASNILEEQKTRVRQGIPQMKEVLQELEILVTPEEERILKQLSFKKIIAYFVYEKWYELGITDILPEDIEKALD